MARASQQDRDYFARVARRSIALEDSSPPATLAEMFDRLDAIRAVHGELARPLHAGDAGDDLASHEAFLERIREFRRRGKIGC